MSQYLTPFRIDEATTTTNTAKCQTVALTANVTATSSAFTSRRILITNGATPAFVAFGGTPTVTINTGFQIPANACLTFNFKSGDKVAAIAGSGSAISIVDLD